jgi:amino acid adenylation domain-containing protein
MADAFGRLLDGISQAPDCVLADLPLLDAAEQQRIARRGDGGERRIEPLCVHELFERQADIHPERTAIVCEGQQLNYAELDARANRLARVLRNVGVTADARVGVCLDRSLELAIALLGVWKAGGAYVPLDPTQPPARRLDMLTDSGASWLLTSESFGADFDGTTAELLSIDSESIHARLHEQSDARLESKDVGVMPQHLAYIIYTSGSSGRPKGVMIEHRSVVNLGQGLRQVLVETGIELPCRWAWNASVAFDASVQALLQWSNGSTLYLLPEALRRNPAALLDHLRTERIDVIDATPLQVEMLLDCSAKDEPLPNLVVGGESISPALWTRIDVHCRSNGTRAINVYGPTEATVDATAVLISGEQPSVGRPLANVRCHVVDHHGQLAPEGVPGELYLVGAGLARGYVNRPELDAERFVELDLRGHRERMYRTGDQVRWLRSGELEFLGRKDDQVKIRGYRVETGEVEQRLRQLPGVASAIVTAFDPGNGVKGLAAYAMAEGDIGDISSWLSELEAALRHWLPEYMIPTYWTSLDAIPLTRSGKLDRTALPSPRRSPGLSVRVAPHGEIEERLAQIWSDLFVLDIDQIDAQANFFEIGGNSLLLMRLMSSIRSIFSVELNLKSVFEARNLREIAAMINTVEPSRQALAESSEAIEPIEEMTW